jgi:hypothetical protein
MAAFHIGTVQPCSQRVKAFAPLCIIKEYGRWIYTRDHRRISPCLGSKGIVWSDTWKLKSKSTNSVGPDPRLQEPATCHYPQSADCTPHAPASLPKIHSDPVPPPYASFFSKWYLYFRLSYQNLVHISLCSMCGFRIAFPIINEHIRVPMKHVQCQMVGKLELSWIWMCSCKEVISLELCNRRPGKNSGLNHKSKIVKW